MSAQPKPMLVLLPGLGADHRLFKHQTAVCPNSYAADWIDPLPNERLEQYAVRFAAAIREELDKRPPASVIVCGLSLGGMIAPYVARELNASGCILFATIREPSQFPRLYYADWLFERLCPPLRPARLFFVRLFARFFLYFPWLMKYFVNPKVVRAFVEMPLFRLTGLSRMMFDWAYRRRSPEGSGTKIFDKPMLHVHGTNDWLLPIRRTNPDIRIEGGGHLLVLTHPEEINEIIEYFVAKRRRD
jgi:pimeloyl-ACP methyl ester carboxylesterase